MRTLEEISKATPADYLSHVPANPQLVAHRMLQAALTKFPPHPEAMGVQGAAMIETTYRFLFVGPGSGLVIKEILALEHIANGLETSRRGIHSAPDGVKGYIQWSLPWELPYPAGIDSQPVKYFHVTIVNKALKSILKPDEWNASVEALKKVSKYIAIL